MTEYDMECVYKIRDSPKVVNSEAHEKVTNAFFATHLLTKKDNDTWLFKTVLRHNAYRDV